LRKKTVKIQVIFFVILLFLCILFISSNSVKAAGNSIEWTYTYETDTKTLILHGTIPSTIDDNEIKIDIGKAFTDGVSWLRGEGHVGENDYNVDYLVPGENLNFRIELTNNTGDKYVYKDGSLDISTPNWSEEFGDTPWSNLLTDIKGYDGKYIPLPAIGSLLVGYFPGNSGLSQYCNTINQTMTSGNYEDNPLTNYMLNWINSNFHPTPAYTNIDEAVNASSGFFYDDGQTNIFAPVANETTLNELATQYPWFDKFAYGVSAGNGLYYTMIKWPDKTMAAASYNAFYKNLFSVYYGSAAINNSSDFTYRRNHCVAGYTDKDGSSYKEMETVFKNAVTSQDWIDGTSVQIPGKCLVDVETGNAYQLYKFGFSTVLTLQKRQLPPTPTTQVVTITGKKTWDDKDNKDGMRPTSITVNLLANGDIIDSKEVTADTNWEYSFANMAKYDGSEEIKYSVSEEPVIGYTTKIDGYNITNTHKPNEIVTTPPLVNAPVKVVHTKTVKTVTKNIVKTKKQVTPKTGDKNNLNVFYILILFAGLAISGSIVYRIKK
jgi:hypothetical protein